MSRKPKSKKNSRRSATRLNGDQSMRFLNAITGYSEEAGVSMDKIAKDCDIPLSLMQKWFSPSVPFTGTIDVIYQKRFCANAGIGRDEIVRLSTVNPFFSSANWDPTTMDINDKPEYMRKAIEELNEKAAAKMAQTAPETAQGEPSDEPESEPISEPDASESVSNEKDLPVDTVPPAPDNNTTPSQPAANAQLSSFEQAIVSLLREHDAACAARSGFGFIDPETMEQQTAEQEQLKQKAADWEAMFNTSEQDLKEATDALEDANRVNDELNKQLKDLRRAIHNKDVELDRLRPIADKAVAAERSVTHYTHFIETDPLFVKRNLTNTDVLNIAMSLWPSRLYFTKTAQKDIRSYQGDAYELLTALRALAINLNEYAHQDAALDEVTLHNVCGFEIALHETTQTDNTKRYRQERMVNYNGKDLYFDKHLKAGHGADSLRVYFEFDKDAECIVIGRCSDHLTTRTSF